MLGYLAIRIPLGFHPAFLPLPKTYHPRLPSKPVFGAWQSFLQTEHGKLPCTKSDHWSISDWQQLSFTSPSTWAPFSWRCHWDWFYPVSPTIAPAIPELSTRTGTGSSGSQVKVFHIMLPVENSAVLFQSMPVPQLPPVVLYFVPTSQSLAIISPHNCRRKASKPTHIPSFKGHLLCSPWRMGLDLCFLGSDSIQAMREGKGHIVVGRKNNLKIFFLCLLQVAPRLNSRWQRLPLCNEPFFFLSFQLHSVSWPDLFFPANLFEGGDAALLKPFITTKDLHIQRRPFENYFGFRPTKQSKPSISRLPWKHQSWYKFEAPMWNPGGAEGGGKINLQSQF